MKREGQKRGGVQEGSERYAKGPMSVGKGQGGGGTKVERGMKPKVQEEV